MLFYTYHITAKPKEHLEQTREEVMESCKRLPAEFKEKDTDKVILFATTFRGRVTPRKDKLVMDMGIVFHHAKVYLEQVEQIILECFAEAFGEAEVTLEPEEVIYDKFLHSMTFRSPELNAFMSLTHHTRMEGSFMEWTLKEGLFKGQPLTQKEALQEAKKLFADESFLEEIKRIYSSKNTRSFIGHPVHYHLRVSNMVAAQAMVELLFRALYNNKRLVSTRYGVVSGLSSSWDEDFANVLFCTDGSSVVICTDGTGESCDNYASSYEETVQGLYNCFKRKAKNTLFVFVELVDKPGFSKGLCQLVKEELPIVELKEGKGSQKAIKQLMKQLAEKAGYGALWKKRPLKLEEEECCISYSEATKLYEEWEKQSRFASYGAYAALKPVKAKKVEQTTGLAYKKLQQLVGLKQLKQLVDEMVAVNKVNRERARLSLSCVHNSMHMLFTGNPGSAKTTVARLLAKIFYEEGIISSGHLVECGRSNLVGKYVGWTANIVRSKFKEARGGILFIDEAYSLVDSSKSFGDEAINTIVQEMENNREDVVVIFAGYPQKMKEFLDRNEGLRSRIAFHLDFPDYSSEELQEIFLLLAQDKGFKVSVGALEQAGNFFEAAVKTPDFGNGRFARNLLEKALLKQSLRLAKEGRDRKLTAEELITLLPQDLEIAQVQEPAGNRKTIGFNL